MNFSSFDFFFLQLFKNVKPIISLSIVKKQAEGWIWPSGCGLLISAPETHKYLWSFLTVHFHASLPSLYLERFLIVRLASFGDAH